MRIEPLTCAIGAELSDVRLADAIHDDVLFQELRQLLIQHRVLFLRDQDISRAEHVAFARRFGELEDHPVAGSDPDHPGLVLGLDMGGDCLPCQNEYSAWGKSFRSPVRFTGCVAV